MKERPNKVIIEGDKVLVHNATGRFLYLCEIKGVKNDNPLEVDGRAEILVGPTAQIPNILEILKEEFPDLIFSHSFERKVK